MAMRRADIRLHPVRDLLRPYAENNFFWEQVAMRFAAVDLNEPMSCVEGVLRAQPIAYGIAVGIVLRRLAIAANQLVVGVVLIIAGGGAWQALRREAAGDFCASAGGVVGVFQIAERAAVSLQIRQCRDLIRCVVAGVGADAVRQRQPGAAVDGVVDEAGDFAALGDRFQPVADIVAIRDWRLAVGGESGSSAGFVVGITDRALRAAFLGQPVQAVESPVDDARDTIGKSCGAVAGVVLPVDRAGIGVGDCVIAPLASVVWVIRSSASYWVSVRCPSGSCVAMIRPRLSR
jgi:hypothetical protein